MRQAIRVCAALGALAAVAAAQAEDAGLEAVTRPSADLLMKFVLPGRIAQVAVKDGDRVKKGDVLVRLDDEAERVKVAQLKALADDLLHVRASEAQLAQKKADLRKLEWAGGQGAATQWEIEHARLEVTISEMSLKKAEFNRDRAVEDYEQARVRVEQMAMRSPIDGRVERVFVEAGEAVEALEQVVWVVSTDPLWTDVPVPLAVARRLKVGDAVGVVFPETEGKAAAGKVVHVASVADAAAETLTIRVEIPNPAGRPAGERVRVRFAAAAPGAP